jgi:hypothetical protein
MEGAEIPCRAGFEREFQPVEDIHIGVISSSLGSHGISSEDEKAKWGRCRLDEAGRNNDDRALLIPKVRSNLRSWNNSGFLVWDPRAKHTPQGYSAGQAEQMIGDFEDTIEAVGDVGCGYESTLEAWYRFLVEPEPPLSVRVGADGRSAPEGVDQAVLDQRKAFLRPDSLVVIVTLTDEDDCSVRDDGFGWLLGSTHFPRPRATSACESDPLSVCCRPCTNQEAAPPADCTALAADPACALPAGCTPGDPNPPAACVTRTFGRGRESNPKGDHPNMRCFDQKRRYGMEFLYPTSRYVRALTEPEVPNRAGELEPNPLFKAPGSTFVRDKSMILYAGLVGVPWQDAATEGSLNASGLEYLKAEELARDGRFELFLGDPKNPDPAKRAPLDPLMIASPNPRAGTHPLTGEAVAPSSSQNPQENSINGHESVNTDDTDLQYACIFPLAVPPLESDDCGAADIPRNRALCQPPTGGAATTTQYYAKAYPGLRHLEVMAGIGNAAVVASICPKEIALPPTDPSYGYNPALAALTDIIIDRFELCLPRPLDVAPDGELPCRIAEALPSPTCDCSALPGRTAPSQELESAVRDELEKGGHCGGDTERDCNTFCVCALAQASGPSLTSCQNDKTAESAEPGYCYIDGERKDEAGQPAPIGNSELVANCPVGAQRKLRFVGRDTPQNGAVTFIACMGATL